ncbi:MAG: tRNA (guanosine(37)-N1)-methyltransferase TrmD, partial [Buchnera aphidicola]|nr:tRNA (guanosine(37)-N1)-methyltransferase TrmD [Buchnera aphidicola]
EEESFSKNLLDYPNYTKPKIFNQKKVPEVLLSGNHNDIRLWRLKESLGKTWIKRPDLLKKNILNKEEKNLLREFKMHFKNKK